MTSPAHDPDHWRKRAEEMRAAASDVKDEVDREALLKLAGEYDHLAERALKRLQDTTRQAPK